MQKIPRSIKSDKPNNITGIDKFHFKHDCVIGSIVNGIREGLVLNYGPDKAPGDKIYKERRTKLFKRIN